MSPSDAELLQRYAREHSEPVFSALVTRHLDLVYSAALPQVRRPHLAQEVAQTVFIELARHADRMKPDLILAAWLHAVTRRRALDLIRRETRRLAREQAALDLAEANATPDPDAATGWTDVAPLLDAALQTLPAAERDAVLLRFFENKSLSEVGQTLGISDDAAQKRVHRALERLRAHFAKRRIPLGAAGLATLLTTHAVQAAPAGLAATVSTATLLSIGTGAGAGLAVAAKTIAMTTLQKSLVTATLALGLGFGVYEASQAHALREQVRSLQQTQREHDQRRQLENARHDAELLSLRDRIGKLTADARELALLKTAAAEKENDPMEQAARQWLTRVDDLGECMAAMPNLWIPEFQFLDPVDWLDIAKDARLETEQDFQNAAQMLGSLAKDRFAKLVRDALNAYLKSSGGELPGDIAQLRPFFPVQVGEDVLARYELQHTGNINALARNDQMFALVSEKRYAPTGSGRPLVRIGTAGFGRTGQ